MLLFPKVVAGSWRKEYGEIETFVN